MPSPAAGSSSCSETLLRLRMGGERLPQQVRLERLRRPRRLRVRARHRSWLRPSSWRPRRVPDGQSPTHCCASPGAVDDHLRSASGAPEAAPPDHPAACARSARTACTPPSSASAGSGQRTRWVEPLEPRVAQTRQVARAEAARRAVDRGHVDRLRRRPGRRSPPPARPGRRARAARPRAPARSRPGP